MKKLAISIILVFMAVILLFASVPMINNFRAQSVEKELISLDLPENTVFLESNSSAGRFFGNGNGIQYVGYMLIESNLDWESLSRYYGRGVEDDLQIFVEEYPKTVNRYSLDFAKFSNREDNGTQRYVVAALRNGNGLLSALDIRAH